MKEKFNDLYQVDIHDYLVKMADLFQKEHSVFTDSDVINIYKKNISPANHVGVFDEKSRTIDDVMQQAVKEVFSYRVRMNDPNFYAFVPSPVSVLSWLGEVLATGFNIHAGSWLQSSGYSGLELKLVAWLGQQFGYDSTSSGVFLSGGSMANMTGLLLARDTKLKVEERHLGVVYISAQTHSSVAKALAMIGFLPHQVRKIAVNSEFQLDLDLLRNQLEADVAQQLKPFLVIASAGTTNTGSIDNLGAIADIAQQYTMWMHVDGAYGGSVILSEKYKHLLAGIEFADSISCDPHKWMFQTYGCSVLLVKDKKCLYQSFHTNPEYLKDAAISDDEVNFWDFGPELTRPARAFKLWFTLQVAGTKLISDAISEGFETAKYAEQLLKQSTIWQIISPAYMAIVNFRYFNAAFTEAELNIINQQIAKRTIDEGKIGVLSTKLQDKNVLRLCCIHPLTSHDNLRHAVQLLSKYAEELVAVC